MTKTTDNKAMLMIAGTASMIAQFNMNNIKLLLSMGYKVDVACNFLQGNNFSQKEVAELKQQLNAFGVGIYQIDFSRKVTNLKADIKAYNEILALLCQKKYTFVHCHMPIVSVLVRKACHKTGTKVIYTAHGFHFFKGAPLKNWLIYYPIEKHYSRYTDILITINQEDYARASKKFHAKEVMYVPGVGIDTEKFSNTAYSAEELLSLRQNLGIPKDGVWLLSVGELNKNKNHETVIKALGKIKINNPELFSKTYYTIAGVGAKKDEINTLAEILGIDSNVKLLGFRSDVAKLCAAADVFVMPSHREGLSVALMEAMAGSLPCAVSKIRGNTDLIDSNGGRLFSSYSVKQCYNVLLYYLSMSVVQRKNYGFYNAKKIRNFDIDTVQKEMKKIYENIALLSKIIS